EPHGADALSRADAADGERATIERLVRVTAQNLTFPAALHAVLGARRDRDHHLAAADLVAEDLRDDRLRFDVALRVLGIGSRLVTRREVRRDVAHACLRSARRRIRADLVPAGRIRRVRRVLAPARAAGPALR